MTPVIRARADGSAEILLYGEIGADLFGDGTTAAAFKRELDELGDVADITIRINSPGGSVFDAMTVYHLLREHRAQLHVSIDGLAASAASLIAMAGDLITMQPGAMMMIHSPWQLVAGDARNLRDAAARLDKVAATMIEAYATRSGLTADKVRELMHVETWFDAAEAVEHGFADEIAGQDDDAALEIAAHFDFSRFTNLPERIAIMAAPTKPAPKDSPHDASVVLARETERRTQIRTSFGRFAGEHRALLDECLDDPQCSIAAAREKLLVKLGEDAAPIAGGIGASPGTDTTTEFRAAYSDALLIRAGIKLDKPHPGARDLLRMSCVDAIRAMLSQRGHRSTGSADQIVASMGTSDFPALLSSTAEKTVLMGYRHPDRGTHRRWTHSATLRDFKIGKRVSTGDAPSLLEVPELAEFKYGSLPEYGVDVQLATYGRILKFSRQAIVNDDIEALLSAARAFGDSALRLEADIVYAVLLANPTMPDGAPLFDASHNNLGTAGALSVTTLGEARKLLRNQRGIGGESYLDLEPAILLVPTTLETVAEQLLASVWDPDAAVAPNTANPFTRRLELVVDPRLDADSATAWYVLASPGAFGWFEAIRLSDQEEPFIDERSGWDVDALEIKARHDFAAAAVAFQGAVKNVGA